MTWSRNPQPRHLSVNAEGHEQGESSPDTDLSRLLARIETLELRCDAERRASDTLARKLREMTSAYHEVLDREAEATEGIALAMLEKPVDMGLLEYVSELDAYTRKLRLQLEDVKIERDHHLCTLMKLTAKSVA